MNIDDVCNAIHDVLNDYIWSSDIDDSEMVDYIVGGIRCTRGGNWQSESEEGRIKLVNEIVQEIKNKLNQNAN